MSLRRIAEELEGCYFDERCEAALCSRIYQPPVVQPALPPKPDASNWPSYDAPPCLVRPVRHLRRRAA